MVTCDPPISWLMSSKMIHQRLGAVVAGGIIKQGWVWPKVTFASLTRSCQYCDLSWLEIYIVALFLRSISRPGTLRVRESSWVRHRITAKGVSIIPKRCVPKFYCQTQRHRMSSVKIDHCRTETQRFAAIAFTLVTTSFNFTFPSFITSNSHRSTWATSVTRSHAARGEVLTDANLRPKGTNAEEFRYRSVIREVTEQLTHLLVQKDFGRYEKVWSPRKRWGCWNPGTLRHACTVTVAWSDNAPKARKEGELFRDKVVV